MTPESSKWRCHIVESGVRGKKLAVLIPHRNTKGTESDKHSTPPINKLVQNTLANLSSSHAHGNGNGNSSGNDTGSPYL